MKTYLMDDVRSWGTGELEEEQETLVMLLDDRPDMDPDEREALTDMRTAVSLELARRLV